MIVTNIQLENAWGISNRVRLSDISQFSILIGKNNSGKSNVLKALKWLSDNIAKTDPFDLEANIIYEPGRDERALRDPSVVIEVRLTDYEKQQIFQSCESPPAYSNILDEVKSLIGNNIRFEIIRYLHKQNKWQISWAFQSEISTFEACQKCLNERYGSSSQHIIQSLLTHSVPRAFCAAIKDKIQFVGGWRSLRDAKNPIVKKLKGWRDPPDKAADRHATDKWDKFRELFEELTRINGVDVRFQQDNEGGLSLFFDKKLLSILDCGEGLQHLLMLSYYLVADPQAVLLVEEPETHLHPELQRNLAQIIKRESSGQVFITTHSPVLLDAVEGFCVYRVERKPHQNISKCMSPSDLRQVLDLLDVRPSDILQANCVIWVEGPTDRRFLKRCFELLNVKLVEGIHYQFAYYGGNVRSHFAFDQLKEKERIDVLKLCRHAIMVCDSDKDKEEDQINPTKERLRTECIGSGGYYWITAGREIENYIPDASLTRTVQRLTGKDDLKMSLEQFGDLPNALRSVVSDAENAHGLRDYGANKVKLMQEFLKDMTPEDLNQYDLKNQLEATIGLVHKWSGANDEAKRVSDVT